MRTGSIALTRNSSPLHLIVVGKSHRLGKCRKRVVVVASRVDRCLCLLDFPGQIFFNHRILIDPLTLNHKPPFIRCVDKKSLALRGVRGFCRVSELIDES